MNWWLVFLPLFPGGSRCKHLRLRVGWIDSLLRGPCLYVLNWECRSQRSVNVSLHNRKANKMYETPNIWNFLQDKMSLGGGERLHCGYGSLPLFSCVIHFVFWQVGPCTKCLFPYHLQWDTHIPFSHVTPVMQYCVWQKFKNSLTKLSPRSPRCTQSSSPDYKWT